MGTYSDCDRKENGAYAATSESSSLPNLDYEIDRYVGPGEIIRMRADGLEQLRKPNEDMQICSFLWVYYGFPVSCYEGRNVEEVRFMSGYKMGKTDESEVDCACGIPDSGVGMALGYAEGRVFLIIVPLRNIHQPGHVALLPAIRLCVRLWQR